MLTDEQGEEGLTGGHGGAGDEGRKWGRTKLIEAGERMERIFTAAGAAQRVKGP